ncbi:hypothetical protein GCM10008090_07200 [Arenicella chitinivorans]|uniref:SPOR domain-containing protein n=1 Tax=Arenicella chitinivorans TaxID=1329800 RepID=A0A918VH26_9GAMM|nr:SPOR domain-containing protein [Arenicella chitinivorans]GHA00754.1 hypothetical protein GCM10008090_07200 [Arenicella chitinivorans]
MSKSTTTPEEKGLEFNLKHRVTGAAVLLFFGALVIPWLLGPPSAASKAGVDEMVDEEATLASAKEIERVLLGPDAQTAEVPEETVYISKITPLDGTSQTQEDEAATTKQVDSKAEKVAELNDDASSSSSEAVTKKTPEVAKQATTKTETKPTQKPVDDAKQVAVKQGQTEQKAREKALLAALEAESKTEANKNLTVGWIVQVGLFVEKSGAQAQVNALKEKGFSAHTTVVDTNRGPKTGTRVWIGPFEKRTDAESHNQQLRAKMGKAGFIRVYP